MTGETGPTEINLKIDFEKVGAELSKALDQLTASGEFEAIIGAAAADKLVEIIAITIANQIHKKVLGGSIAIPKPGLIL